MVKGTGCDPVITGSIPVRHPMRHIDAIIGSSVWFWPAIEEKSLLPEYIKAEEQYWAADTSYAFSVYAPDELENIQLVFHPSRPG